MLGKFFPQIALALDKVSIYQVSIPIAICLFFMMYPIMVKIDFTEVIKAGKAPKPVILTLFYVGLPLFLGYHSRKLIIAKKGFEWFEEKFLHCLTPVSITALLVTLILLFSFKGEFIIRQPQTILLIAIPLFIQTCFIFAITYALARWLRLPYRDAAPSALIGASNHFEVAIATSTILFGLSSGAALATVVGVLIEVPVMLMLVRVCLRTKHFFDKRV